MEYKPVKAPRGNIISCKGWHQEAAMRMLMNNLDEEVAEKPQELIIYGGSGKAARNWECYHAIVESLKNLENDETLLVQSGKPVGIFKTHPYAPRVLIANSHLVPAWATWEKFRELERLGLIMFGQMTAGSWIYIGTQGILQGTYETLASVAKKHFSQAPARSRFATAAAGRPERALHYPAQEPRAAGRCDFAAQLFHAAPGLRGRSDRGILHGTRRAARAADHR